MTSKDIKTQICDKPFPETTDECLILISKVEYKSYGFPVFQLYYDYTFNHWSIVFRNPDGFKNPKIKAKTPLGACHDMLKHIKQCIINETI